MVAVRSCPRAEQVEEVGRLGWAPPAFPNPGPEQRLILQFTMALALRLVNDTPRYVEGRDIRIGVRSSKICWLPEISLLLLLFPAWSGAGQVGRRGEQEDWRCKFPTLGLLSSRPARGLEWSGACNLLTLQVVVRESGWWVRSRSVSTNQPL